MFELCITSNFYGELSAEGAVKRLVSKDWRYLDLSGGHGHELLKRGNPMRIGREFRRFAEDAGAFIPQGHLWYESDIASPSQQEVIDGLKSWLDLFMGIGISQAVLHVGGQWFEKQGINYIGNQEVYELRVKALQQLTDYIRDTEMTICVENNRFLRNADGLVELIQGVGSQRLGICLDTGHENRFGTSQRNFILKSGSYLKALHINDNEGADDQHIMPYTGTAKGKVNWVEVIDALKEIGYTNVFNLEIPGESKCPIEIRDAKLDYLKTILTFMIDGG